MACGSSTWHGMHAACVSQVDAEPLTIPPCQSSAAAVWVVQLTPCHVYTINCLDEARLHACMARPSLHCLARGLAHVHRQWL